MAYSNTSIANAAAAVSAIATFAGSNGWTVHQNAVSGSYHVATLSYSGSTYITLAALTNGTRIYMNAHRTFDGGEAWNAQPDQYYNGADTQSRTECKFTSTSLSSVFLFADTTPQPAVYAAIEISAGYYRHIWFGLLEKQGSYAGGLFFDCADVDSGISYLYSTYWERNRYPLIWNDTDQDVPRKGGLDAVDSLAAAKWYSFGRSSAYSRAGCFGAELLSWIYSSPIQFNQNTPLFSPTVFMSEGGTYKPAGRPPNVRYINMTNYNAADEFVLGSDTWKVFPAIRKLNFRYSGGSYSHDPANESSHFIGLAYKK